MRKNSLRRKITRHLHSRAFFFPRFRPARHAAQKKGPAGSVFSPDKGKLNILLDGKSVGREELRSPLPAAVGSQRHHQNQSSPRRCLHRHRHAHASADGAPISYEWTSKLKTNGAHILFANGIAKSPSRCRGPTLLSRISPWFSFIVVLDNNLYYQYAVLARVYDWSAAARKATLSSSPGTHTRHRHC